MGLYRFRVTLLLFLAALSSGIAYAYDPIAESQRPAKPLALLHRCYKSLAGKAPALNDPLYLSIKNNAAATAADAVNACLQLLDLAKLRTSDFRVQAMGTAQEKLGIAVLQNMHRFYKSWFAVPEIVEFYHTLDSDLAHHDPNPGANFLAYNLFGARSYREIVTSAEDVQALRTLGPALVIGDNIPGSHTKGIQQGVLQGLKPRNASHSNHLWYGPGGASIGSPAGPWDNSFVPGRMVGTGGVLSNNDYLYLNIASDRVQNGGGYVHRNLAKNTLESLLCLKSPYIRVGTASAIQQSFTSQFPNSNLTFRKQASCLQCHGTLDYMSFAWRNFAMPGFIFLSGMKTTFTFQFSQIAPPHALEHSEGSGDFMHSRPDFILRFQSYLSESEQAAPAGYRSFTRTNVTSAAQALTELGSIFSNLDELYACAAKRHFEHFTGVKIQFVDPGVSTLTPEQRHYRNIVFQLGQQLKQHQSLRTLIRDILSSPTFQKKGMRDLL